MFKKGLIAASLVLGVLSFAHADEQTVIKNIKDHEKMAGSTVVINHNLTNKIKEKYPSIDGYIVSVNGANLLSNADGTLVFQLSTAFQTDTMEPLQSFVNYELMEGNKDWYTVPLPEGVDKKADVYVFTDPTCGYCRKMHSEKALYDMLGIQLHVIPYPSQGLTYDNPGYSKWVDVVCSAEPGQAYHDVIMGKEIAPPTEGEASSKSKSECEAEIEKGYRFGREIGLRGTPYIIGYGQSGERMMTPGYVPINELAKGLGVESK